MKLIVLLFSVALPSFLIAQTKVTTSDGSNCFQSVMQDAVIVGDLKGFNIIADVFKAQKGLMVNLPHIVDVTFTIVSYKYMRVSNKHIAFNANVVGANFSEEVLEDVAKVRPGDIVFFDDIKLKDSTGGSCILPTVKYKLL